VPGMRHRAWRFHVRAQHLLLVRLGDRRHRRDELRHEDERAAEASEPMAETGGAGRQSWHSLQYTMKAPAPLRGVAPALHHPPSTGYHSSLP
jgi:hypothetical protein